MEGGGGGERGLIGPVCMDRGVESLIVAGELGEIRVLGLWGDRRVDAT